MDAPLSSISEARTYLRSLLPTLTAEHVLTPLDSNDQIIPDTLSFPYLATFPMVIPYLQTDDYAKEDTANDDQFYVMPRFVTHVDSGALYALSLHYSSVFSSVLDQLRSNRDNHNQSSSSSRINHASDDRHSLDRGLRVLDLGASWVSHYPEEIEYDKVIGIGMNEHELQRNGRLDNYLVYNFNDPLNVFSGSSTSGHENRKELYANLDFRLSQVIDNPKYSELSTEETEENTLSSSSSLSCNQYFDIITCALTIQYMEYPIDLFTKLRSFLRSGTKGSMIIISFSNRMFPTKAVNIWKGLSSMQQDVPSMTEKTSNISASSSTTDAPGPTTGNTLTSNLPVQHLYIVASYLHYSGYRNIQTFDLSPSDYTDPLYIVQAYTED